MRTLTDEDVDAVITALVSRVGGRILPYQIGTQLVATETKFTALNQGDLLAHANANRVVLGFSVCVGECIATTVFAGSVTPQCGIHALNTFAPVFLNISDHGTLPQLAWYAAVSEMTIDLSVFEVVWKPSG